MFPRNSEVRFFLSPMHYGNTSDMMGKILCAGIQEFESITDV